MPLRAVHGFAVLCALLGGCVAMQPDEAGPNAPPPSRAPVEPGRYFVTSGHDAASVAELRVVPPPQVAETTEGASIRGDERKLVARSFVRIGAGCYPAANEAARDWALRMGAQVGAEKILIYTRPDEAKKADVFVAEANTVCVSAQAAQMQPDWAFVATYYVRFRLPFGAQFRSLRADEAKALGVAGGVQIGSVVAGTPAAEANLRSGDFVLKFNGAPVRDRNGFQEGLRAHMGKKVVLTIRRGAETIDRPVRLGVIATLAH